MHRRLSIAVVLALLSAVITASAHDLFLKLDSYFLKPNSTASVRLLNGTFAASDGVVSRERFRAISLLGPSADEKSSPTIKWRDEAKTTVMEFQTGDAGTYVVGVSTKPREIELKAADFNDYLSHDGIPDTLTDRRRDKELNKDVKERYSKHVRALFQVGDKLSDEYERPLGYPVEIIPQQNPYALRAGQLLEVLCTLEGSPIANQFVMAGREGADGKLRQLTARTDANGIARVKLSAPGKWFVKFIHMTKLSDAALDYESKWASLTFEVKASK